MNAPLFAENNATGSRAQSAILELADCAFDLLGIAELPDLQFVHLNGAGRRLLELPTAESLEGLRVTDFVNSQFLTTLLYEVVPGALQGGEWRGETTLRTHTGGACPVQLIVLGVSSAENDREWVAIAAIDTSTTSEVKSSLQTEQILLRSLLEHVTDSVYFKDLQSRFIRVSAYKARQINRRQPQELIGESDFDHFSAEHAQKAFDDEQRIIASGQPIIDLEEKETWPDGRITWSSSSKFPLRDQRGRILGTFGISRDITARKLAEEERRQMEIQLQLAQKLESIGRLAAGIAHEVNTPTQFINDNTHFLKDVFGQITNVITLYRDLRNRAAKGEDCTGSVAAIEAAEAEAEVDYLLKEIPRTLDQNLEGIARIARIVRSLKEFSHPNSPDKCPANLNHAIETAVTVSRHEWKYVADVVTELDPDLPSVPCVLDEFNQVMLNLVVNAAHAIGDVVENRPGERGTITIRTRRDHEVAIVEVSDTGTGIPEHVRGRIFEPFYTTKSMGKGTGQGLAIVQSVIVNNHGGTITFDTELGRGTTFTIRLPLRPAEPRDAAADANQGHTGNPAR